MLHSPRGMYSDITPPKPVWWNESADGGRGNWSTTGCELRDEVHGNLVFQCKQLGYYGLLQNISFTSSSIIGAKFRLSHPAIYIGSFVLFFCLFVAILTYCICYMSIQMPKKTKHSLINMWIAVVLLLFVYAFGIYQTEDMQLCQSIGLMLHYFTLSSLFWMCVGVTTMYERLHKHDITELQDDELPSGEPIQKPILGLYLVGWGIALIICGISGAVNMKEYASSTRCFLDSSPTLSAVFVPFGGLLLFLCALFLLVRCAIYSSDTSGHLSEGTQVTENVDLELLEPSFPNPDRHSIHSASTKTRSSEVEDSEHAPAMQLKAYIIFLFIYVLSWCCCALATVCPFKFPHEEDVFSILYAVFASLLGMFTLFFYCIARNDIRIRWMLFRSCIRRKGMCFRSRTVSDTPPNIPQIQIQPLPPIPPATTNTIDLISRPTSRSSSQSKSISNNSNVLRAAANLNLSSLDDPPGAKINNVNLVVLHRQQYRTNNFMLSNVVDNPNNTLQAFYNPYQSTVARKFFKRQRQSMLKRNNLRLRRAGSDSASMASSRPACKIDQSYFSPTAKVNNTNIHVEHVRKQKQRNLNVLSDSHEDLSHLDKTYASLEKPRRRDINRHRTRKKQNTANSSSAKNMEEEINMRSVSQQCSLEYSSDSPTPSLLTDRSGHCGTSCGISDLPLVKNGNVCCQQGYLCNIDDSKQLGSSSKANRYEPSEISLSVVNSTSELSESTARVYVNPVHDLHLPKRVQSRASSVSTSEIDELYQQIRRGSRARMSHSRTYVDDLDAVPKRGACHRPRPLDSEISAHIDRLRNRPRALSLENGSDNVETIV